MRSAEIVGCHVFDRDGRDVGAVHDIRIEAGAPAQAGSGFPAYRIRGLIVGSVAIAHRLGYSHGQMAGPWLLDKVFHRLARRSVFVPWSDVTGFERPRIEIRSRRGDLAPVLDVPERTQRREAQ